MKITWLGHSSFKIETSGKIIYIDPYVLPKNSPLADVILITHEHYDHCDPAKVEEIRKEKTKIVATVKAGGKLSGEHIQTVKPEDSFDMQFPILDYEGIKVQVVPAYNVTKHFHPKGDGVGFIIECEDKRVYHAGDTDFIPEMKSFQGLTVALLPIGGTYTMGINDAVEAAISMKPKIVVPMHYNFLGGLEANAEDFKQKVESQSQGQIKVEILEGRELEL